MKRDGSVFVIIMLLGLVSLCAVSIVSSLPQKTTEEISMIDVCGMPWCASYDAHYAQNVNLPNSEANVNNAQAEFLEAKALEIESKAADAQLKYGALGAAGAAGFFIMLVIGGGLMFLVVRYGMR